MKQAAPRRETSVPPDRQHSW